MCYGEVSADEKSWQEHLALLSTKLYIRDTIIRWNVRNAAALEKLLLKRAGYFEALKGKKAMTKGSRHQRAAEYTPARHSEESELEPPPRYDREYHGYRTQPVITNGIATDHLTSSANSPGATISGSTGARIGAAVGGWLGGLHGRATKTNARQNEVDEQQVAPARPPRPATLT